MAQVVVFGAGDIARLAHYYFTNDSPHDVVAFCVDEAYRDASEFRGLPLLGFEELTGSYPPDRFSMFVALSYASMNQVRAAKYATAKERGYELVSYVSSRATCLNEHPFGDNCFILEDNTVQPFVKIGNDVTLWSGNHIGHDSTIEDHCFVTSHVVVSGNCTIGAYSFIGVNATLRHSLRVAPRTLVAAGAVVMQDTVEKGVYVPPRAKLARKNSDEIKL